jgi:hypothetical protein
VLPIVPVLWLLGLGILNLLGWEEVPVLLQGAGLCLLVVDEDLVGVVGVQDEGVEVSVDVILAPDVLRNKLKILSITSTESRKQKKKDPKNPALPNPL